MSYIIGDMMTPAEFLGHLDLLHLSQTEAAHLLSTTPRTLRRWADGPDQVPGPAEQALRAWVRLQSFGLPWRPDAASFLARGDEEKIARQIALHTQHAMGLETVIAKVAKRGGPAAPWQVDLEKSRATLGPVAVTFYRLHDGGFSPQCYTRRDMDPDLRRDLVLLEDAWYCVARAIADERRGSSISFARIQKTTLCKDGLMTRRATSKATRSS